MEIKEIKYIKTIADYSNITRASEELYITQPSLSQSLKKIEANLGVELFKRTKKGMILTEHGEQFLHDASPVLNSYEQFIEKVKQYEYVSTTKHIGLFKLSYTTPVNSAVMNYISLHHDNNYMIKVDNVSNLERMLLRNELDIAIIKYTPIYKRNCHLIYDTLFKEELYVLLNKNHPLASKKIINVCDLKGNRLITSDPKEYPFKMTKFVLREAGVKLDIHTHTNYSNLSMIFDLVGKGIGITFATAYVCRYCKRDDIVSIVLDGEYDYEVCAVQKTQTVENSSLVEFIEKFINNC